MEGNYNVKRLLPDEEEPFHMIVNTDYLLFVVADFFLMQDKF